MFGPDNLILWIAVGVLVSICLFILGLLAPVIVGRSALSRSATSKATSQTPRDLIWTLAPVFAFVVVAVPLIRLLYFQNTIPAADLTITVTGQMWYWTFKYPDYGNFSFSTPMLSTSIDEQLPNPKLFGKYNHIVVPVAKTVRIVAVGTNVIYSWAIPSIGAKVEALPGQTNQSWFTASTEGQYYGECSELCGLPHTFKPVEIEVVSQARFNKWVAQAKEKLAAVGTRTPHGVQVQ